ncbi:class I SAM-dependent methyltransferase [Leeuwenhoekiella sp. H156]|uniref:class I SAM-dependent methyltransferase n=1 Tax=Leeuwenhoekiella sp. H156 TaxID=3450128 RepID=UPI003FA428E6
MFEVNPSNNSTLVKTYKTKDLISKYQKQLNFDITQYYKGIDEIKLYEELSSGYQYYYPLDIYGDSAFYEHLQKFDWYYMPWKWEHEYLLNKLNKKDKVLEVGAGGLGFIQKLSALNFDCVGLELNEQSIEKARELGLDVKKKSIQAFSLKNNESFDVVCSFQVLEHITDVHSFISSKIKSLKPGGRLVICVPNNDSFIKYDEGGILNFPPHHAGRWNRKSLNSVASYFNLEIVDVVYEPLQAYHSQWYISSLSRRLKKNFFINRINKFLSIDKFIRAYVEKYRSRIIGHSIMFIYKKKH